ncbi:MAG: hypothetical protein IPK33_08345 [Gemmatimonadetes bacterium]|nr:hypothetical protein [Gemmatimonadota bacterium]
MAITDGDRAQGERARSALIGSVGITFAVVGLAIWLSRQMPPESGPSLGGELTSVQDKALSEALGLTKLLIGWSLGVVGAVGFFLKGTAESKLTLRPQDLVVFGVSALLALIAVLLGCQVLSNAVLLLHLNRNPVGDPIVDPYLKWQYRALVASVLVLILAGLQFFWRDGEGNATTTTPAAP